MEQNKIEVVSGIFRVATMYGLYGMSGPYIVLMYGSNPYIFGRNVRIKSVHFGLSVRIKDFLSYSL